MSLAGLVRFSLTQRLLMLLLVALLLPAGWWAIRTIPIDAFPDISPTQVKIIMKAPGMTPEEVESRITRLIEVELLGVQRQTMLRSVAKYALTDITVDFEEGTDIYWARQQVAERLAAVQDSLPPGISGGLAPMSTPLGEMYMFTVDSPELSLAERRYLLDWVIRPALRTVSGVADVNALGGLVKTYSIAPRPDAMLALDVTTEDIAAALEINNQNDGAGRLGRGEESLLVRSEGALENIGAIEATPVDFRDGRLITIGMVADVSMGSLERYGAVTQNGTGEAVEGLVVSLRGANARDVIAGIEEKLEVVRQTLPEHVSINVFYNRSHLVNRAVATVSRALVEAVVLVLVLLGLFLGNFRSALTVALILPLSALATFIAMKLSGLSANLMSLGGLAIAIGLLVDAAVVVVENIVTKMTRSDRAGPAAASHHLPCRQGRCRARYLGHTDHHPGVPAPVVTAGPGGQAVPAGRADHRVCAGRFLVAGIDRDPGAGIIPDYFGRTPGTLASAQIVRLVPANAGQGSGARTAGADTGRCPAGPGVGVFPFHRQNVHADDG